MFKTSVTAALAASLLASTALAADTTGSRHDGAYIGGTVGYSSTVFSADVQGIDLGADGAFVGGYVGFGKVVSGVYLGIEADAVLTDVSGDINNGYVTVTGSTDWLASVRGRIGLPLGPALVYGTVGVAFADVELKETNEGGSISPSETMIGVAGGGGVELAITDNLSARLEAIYYAFPDEKFDFGEFGKVEVDQSVTVVRAGVGFKF